MRLRRGRLRDVQVTPNTGNVLADLGLPDAEDRLARAELARQIAAAIRDRRLTQTAAARLLGTDQPKVSALAAGQLAGFSIERLAHWLTLLGKDVQIVVREKPPERPAGRLTVVSARRVRTIPSQPASSTVTIPIARKIAGNAANG